MLIMDRQSSHTTNLILIERARERNIVPPLPSHCTHRMQLLDISLFKSLKLKYNKAVRLWIRRHPGRPVTEYQIAQLFFTAYGQAAKVGNAMAGFRSIGIVPFNPESFTEADFQVAKVTERDLPDVEPHVEEPTGPQIMSTNQSNKYVAQPTQRQSIEAAKAVEVQHLAIKRSVRSNKQNASLTQFQPKLQRKSGCISSTEHHMQLRIVLRLCHQLLFVTPLWMRWELRLKLWTMLLRWHLWMRLQLRQDE